MTVYVVIVADRHCDPEAEVFTTLEAALAYARDTADLWLQEQAERPEGWLFYAKHPSEEDAIWVVEKTPDQPPPT